MARAQASMEYLLILALALILLIPIIAYLFQETSQSLRINQAKDVVETVAKTADIVYALGPGNERTIRVNIPTGITNQAIVGTEVILYTNYKGMETDVHYSAKVSMSGDLPTEPGIYTLHLTLNSFGYVEVTY